MVGVHNYYYDFLKSFKKFISNVFPEIQNYQFNYSDSTYLNYELYKNHVNEFPMCNINISNIRAENNAHVIRTLPSGSNLLFHLCNNNTQKESVLMEFKFVYIDINVRLNLDNSGDIFNYMNMLQTIYPVNMMFYDYIYGAYIEIDDFTKHWSTDDELENVYYKSVNDKIKKYAIYDIEPVFKITGINSSKNIELKGQPDNFVELTMEAYLKVPNRIGNNTINEQLIKGIQLIINSSDYNENLPILIDMDNDIYSSNKHKISKLYILKEDDFLIDKETDMYNLTIDKTLIEDMNDKKLAVYMIDDSCKNNPDILFIELGVYENLVLTNKVSTKIELDKECLVINIGATDLNKKELIDFNFGNFNRLELLIFN